MPEQGCVLAIAKFPYLNYPAGLLLSLACDSALGRQSELGGTAALTGVVVNQRDCLAAVEKWGG